MKAIIITIAALFLLASPAMAGQCPTLIKQLDGKPYARASPLLIELVE